MKEITDHIRVVPDFPKKGINFFDITTLVKKPKAFGQSVDMMAEMLDGVEADFFVAPEARGFIFASALAIKLKKGLVVARKPGKLPYNTASISYNLEYGQDELEIHEGDVDKTSKVVIIDDVLATGGTARATGDLVEKMGGGITGYLFLMELIGLGGAEALSPHPVWSLLKISE